MTPRYEMAPSAKGYLVSIEDKLRIARQLDQLGVSLSGGWARANPRCSFRQLKEELLTQK